ncbi:MAG: ABC transporter ATP-binding protein [Candidatus Doudnabacteria bacterium]|nr:ABC transporter ATP-binding protein [Candidatus Doudnabacteria bacterium]
MQEVITIRGLQKRYQLRTAASDGLSYLEAVRDVTFSVQAGEIFGLLGPNGAGKTTILEIIECLKQPSGGEVAVLGLDVARDPNAVKRRIGVQLQSSEYLPSMTAAELLHLFGSFYGKAVDATALLRLVGLEDKAGEYIKNFSGGQKQRFSIASSLVNEPEILFLDEPTTGLDPKARRDLWELVRQINTRGITIVLTTHYMEEAEYLCSRVAIIDHGQVLKIDEPKKLINDLSHTTQISFFVTQPVPETVWQPIQGSIERVYSKYPKVILEISSLDVIGPVLDILRSQKIEFSGFTVKTASLEDVYLDLTGKEYEV